MIDLKKTFRIWQIWRLKHKARRLAKKHKVQYFVVKWQGRVELINKNEFKHLRQNGFFPKSFTADNLKKISLYHT